MHLKGSVGQAVGVIFAGGDGKRLWPISTRHLPKQVNPIISSQTLFVEAYERALLAFPKERIVVVTTKQLEPIIRHLVKISDKNIIVQPSNADTAVAISLTALHLEIFFPDCVAVMLFSDHKISGLKNFITTIKRVTTLAQKNNSIICIGTTPTEPQTQYGYIHIGEKTKYSKLFTVRTFTEKPDKKTAQLFVNTGEYLWNTGVYVWKTSVLLQEIKKHAPDIYQELLQLRITAGTDQYAAVLEEWFTKVDKISFEKKVTEKLQKLYVFHANYTWQDIGNWNNFYLSCIPDDDGNVMLPTSPDSVIDAINTKGCLVIPHQHRIALLGVKNLIVVQTDTTIFISERKAAYQVKDFKEIPSS
jgi:mannose-1-phosphate guanylyltransferase